MLDQASQYGVKVMFTLTNNWKTFDSKYNVRPFPGPCCSKNEMPAGRPVHHVPSHLTQVLVSHWR